MATKGFMEKFEEDLEIIYAKYSRTMNGDAELLLSTCDFSMKKKLRVLENPTFNLSVDSNTSDYESGSVLTNSDEEIGRQTLTLPVMQESSSSSSFYNSDDTDDDGWTSDGSGPVPPSTVTNRRYKRKKSSLKNHSSTSLSKTPQIKTKRGKFSREIEVHGGSPTLSMTKATSSDLLAAISEFRDLFLNYGNNDLIGKSRKRCKDPPQILSVYGNASETSPNFRMARHGEHPKSDVGIPRKTGPRKRCLETVEPGCVAEKVFVRSKGTNNMVEVASRIGHQNADQRQNANHCGNMFRLVGKQATGMPDIRCQNRLAGKQSVNTNIPGEKALWNVASHCHDTSSLYEHGLSSDSNHGTFPHHSTPRKNARVSSTAERRPMCPKEWGPHVKAASQLRVERSQRSNRSQSSQKKTEKNQATKASVAESEPRSELPHVLDKVESPHHVEIPQRRQSSHKNAKKSKVVRPFFSPAEKTKYIDNKRCHMTPPTFDIEYRFPGSDRRSVPLRPTPGHTSMCLSDISTDAYPASSQDEQSPSMGFGDMQKNADSGNYFRSTSNHRHMLYGIQTRSLTKEKLTPSPAHNSRGLSISQRIRSLEQLVGANKYVTRSHGDDSSANKRGVSRRRLYTNTGCHQSSEEAPTTDKCARNTEPSQIITEAIEGSHQYQFPSPLSLKNNSLLRKKSLKAKTSNRRYSAGFHPYMSSLLKQKSPSLSSPLRALSILSPATTQDRPPRRTTPENTPRRNRYVTPNSIKSVSSSSKTSKRNKLEKSSNAHSTHSNDATKVTQGCCQGYCTKKICFSCTMDCS